MQKIAQRAGFRSVLRFGEGSAPGPVTFYLIDYRVDNQLKLQLLSRVRGSTTVNTRFSPVIVVVNDCPFEEIIRYVHLGFDDVIVLPEKATLITNRLETALTGENTYYETPTYFGPDRRRMEREARPSAGGPQSAHTRYAFVRNPVQGVQIVGRYVSNGGVARAVPVKAAS